MTLTLSMIVKDGLEDLKRLKPIVSPYIDEWIVVMPPGDEAIDWAKKNDIKVIVKDFTQGIHPDVLQEIKGKFGMTVAHDYRLFNFTDARNESFKHATSDYIMWLDADDEPVGMENLKILIENSSADMFDAVYDYAKDEEGNSISDHIRERVIKNNGRFSWKGGKLGLIHETILADEDFTPLTLGLDKKHFYIKHDSDHQDESSERNFIALLFEYITTKAEDPRTIYYLGSELFNHKFYEQSIKIMQEYVQRGGWDEERYRAWIRIGEAYHQLGDRESGRNAYLEATKELPYYPDAYLSLGESYWSEEDWTKAIEFTMTGLQKPLPQTKSALDITRYTFRPLIYMSLAYLQLGKQAEAYKWYAKAKKLNPKHKWVKEYSGMMEEAKDLDDYVKSFVKLGQLSQRLYPKTLSKLAEVVPDELKDQELLMDFKWRYSMPKVWSNKSVVFFCSTTYEDWGPESLETGCGGSEEAVIQLSRQLTKLGWEVTVYANCIKEGKVDGIDWIRFERFNPRDMFNILVSWRNNIFSARNYVKKFVDMHDVPDLKFYSPEAVGRSKILAKSEYHRSLLPGLPDENFKIIPNGIDPEQFSYETEKVPNSLVWTSSYERGLENLLQMWPDIRKEVPDATIDIYYGFNTFDVSPWGKSPKGQAWKAKMIELFEQDGVTEHGRVGTDDIAKAYMKAEVWAYPTSFPEIDCITATKAQASRVIPVTTDYAVLKERNQGIMIKGDINDDIVKEEFKRELIALLKDDKLKEEISKKLDVSAYSWENVAKQWDEEFNR